MVVGQSCGMEYGNHHTPVGIRHRNEQHHSHRGRYESSRGCIQIQGKCSHVGRHNGH